MQQFLTFQCRKKDTEFSLSNKCIRLRQKQVIVNTDVLKRWLDVIEIQENQVLSCRRRYNELGIYFENQNFGNFLEIILIISQFDVFLSHLKSKVFKVRKDRETPVRKKKKDMVSLLFKTTILYIYCQFREVRYC